MKKLLFSLVVITIMCLFTASSCEGGRTDSNRETSIKQEKMMKEANDEVGMPAITNFQEKKIAKMIFELRDREDLVCYAYIVNHMTGKLVFIGKCMGYGLPYSTQYTNPVKPITGYPANVQETVIPQADLNGLFMPEGLSATWLMMLDPETQEPRPVYLEPEIIVSPFKLEI